MQRARDRIREITDSERLRDQVEVIVRELNRFLRGWANYFRYGNSRLHFTRMTTDARRRLALFVAKRHKRASGYGMTVVAYASPNRMGLVNIDRLVVTPAPSGTGGPCRMPPAKDVGEPCAGEPHARIDVAAGRNRNQSGQHVPHGTSRLPPTRPPDVVPSPNVGGSDSLLGVIAPTGSTDAWAWRNAGSALAQRFTP